MRRHEMEENWRTLSDLVVFIFIVVSRYISECSHVCKLLHHWSLE